MEPQRDHIFMVYSSTYVVHQYYRPSESDKPNHRTTKQNKNVDGYEIKTK